MLRVASFALLISSTFYLFVFIEAFQISMSNEILRNTFVNTRKLLTSTTILSNILSTPPYRVIEPSSALFRPFSRSEVPAPQSAAPPSREHSVLRTNFVRDAVRTVGPSVARIDCDREIPAIMAMFSDLYKEGDTVKVSGSGIVIKSDGYIITNAHVVDMAKRLTITLSNGRVYKSKVIAFDELTDLAVLKAEVLIALGDKLNKKIGAIYKQSVCLTSYAYSYFYFLFIKFLLILILI